MLQARRSPVQVPDEVDFFSLPNLSSRTMVDSGIFLGVKSGRRVGLTTLPPSMSRMSENVGASSSRNPKGLHGLYWQNLHVDCSISNFTLHDYAVMLYEMERLNNYLERNYETVKTPCNRFEIRVGYHQNRSF
jgi:hypothetical protein